MTKRQAVSTEGIFRSLFRISLNSFRSNYSIYKVKKNAIKQKLYENFYNFHFQKRIASTETIRENTVIKGFTNKNFYERKKNNPIYPFIKNDQKLLYQLLPIKFEPNLP